MACPLRQFYDTGGSAAAAAAGDCMKTWLRMALAGIVLPGALHAAVAAAEPLGSRFGSRVGEVQMSVYDLAPADGIAAGYAIASVSNAFSLDYSVNGIKVSRTGVFDEPGTMEHSGAGAHLQAAWEGVGELSVSGDIDTPSVNVYTTAKAIQTVVITLAPGTAFVVTGLSTLAASAYGNPWAIFSNAALIVELAPDDGASQNVTVFDSFPVSPVFDIAQTYALAYSNASAVPRDVTLSYQVIANGNVTPISESPEPSTFVMLGAGLAALCLRARRERANRAIAGGQHG